MILQREGGRGTSRTGTAEEAVVAGAGIDQKYCYILIALPTLINLIQHARFFDKRFVLTDWPTSHFR